MVHFLVSTIRRYVSSISTELVGWGQRSGRGHQRSWSWNRVPPWSVLSKVRVETEYWNVLDAEESIIFGDTLTTSRSTGLDLAGTEGNDEVSNYSVLGLTRPVRDHHAPTVGLR